eukprot:TRINITY_DN11357_c0_g1_i1.p1 TRINITY_DN11357_c0_g1~~TRINITY_DN11357_c0_g1_i1.p1  ORF type:complete len:270 (-),score=1.77 TRINITY_DN11357_c0_g1_i1:56-865(-)
MQPNQPRNNGMNVGYLPVSFSNNATWNISIGIFKMFDGYLYFHWSFIILFAFYWYMSYVSGSYLGKLISIGLGFCSSLVLLLTIIFHELGHAVVFKYGCKYQVTGIYIWGFGGLTATTYPVYSENRKMSILGSLIGPAVNGFFAGLFFLIWFLIRHSSLRILIFWMHWIAWSQLILTLYNLLPGIDLDGGKALLGTSKLCCRTQTAEFSSYFSGSLILLVVSILIAYFFSIWFAFFMLMTFFTTAYACYVSFQKCRSPQNQGYNNLQQL